MRLFQYISGANIGRQRVEMTVPVLTKVTPGSGPLCNSTFVVSFFYPYKFQGAKAVKPPVPTSPDVYITTLPPLKVFVHSFGGYMQGKDWSNKAAAFANTLQTAGVQTQPGHWYFAGYDSPFKLFNRHNEVWIPAKV